MNKIIRYTFLMVCLLSMSWPTSCSDDDDNLGSGTIKITSFSPEKGLPGTEVTINGSGFSDEAKVYFNEAEATDYVSRSANAIVVRVPKNAASGRIGVAIGEKDYGFSTGEFTFIPSAAIEKYSIGRAPIGETITIYGRNFFDIDVADITIRFGNAVANIISATSTEITVVIPEGAETAPITIQFGDIQTIEGPVFEIGKILVEVPDYYFTLSQYEMGGGNFSVDNAIGSTKRGAYLIYPCKVDVDGLYELTARTARIKQPHHEHETAQHRRQLYGQRQKSCRGREDGSGQGRREQGGGEGGDSESDSYRRCQSFRTDSRCDKRYGNGKERRGKR